jgi:alkaline phosphatase D
MHEAQTRRRLLARAAGLAGFALTPMAWASDAGEARLFGYPFTLGVASGEPAPDGVVLWTRLAPRPDQPDGGMGRGPVRVAWEIAEDEGLTRIAARGRTLAVAEAGHSVHVEVAGLKPGREYWYRFAAGGEASPVGRTCTAPAPGAPVERLRLAYGACQRFEQGFYAAHADIARHAPDLVLFLGDYIYEKIGSLEGVRPHPLLEAHDLAGYRLRYATYKADPDLQAAHAAAPWMTIWDDHEVSNDYGGLEGKRDGPAAFVRRRAAAYQAYYEHMPLRRTSLPVGPQMQLFRTLDWGGLAQFQFLDTRQYRSHRACAAEAHGRQIDPDCAERLDPARSLLGARQEAWLGDRLRTTPARWNVLAQQYPMGPLARADGTVSNDGWDGFPAARRRVLETWRDAAVANPLVLGGDVHSFLAGELALAPDGPPIASEFVGGSISSTASSAARLRQAPAINPNLRFAEPDRRGYGLVEITPQATTVTFRAVADARVAGSPVDNLQSFVVEAGRPGLLRA